MSPARCMEALRALSADVAMDADIRLLAAGQAIKTWLARANPVEQRGMLLALDSEIVTETTAAPATAVEFWSWLRDMIAQFLNQLPDKVGS